MSIKKPMLAASMENSKGEQMSFSDLKYPLMASIKLDGIRCLRVDGKTLSRSFKPIPNKYIQKRMNELNVNNLDGELVTYNEDGSVRTFNEIQGDIMSEDGEPNFKFEIFDYMVMEDLHFQGRYQYLEVLFASGSLPDFCKLVKHELILDENQLTSFEDQAVADGHEGIMTRSLEGKYKFGRATFKSQDLIKIKRFIDSEAIIIGFEEKLRNENEAETDGLGHTKRSSAKAGLVPAGTLGTLLVRDIKDGREFGIGTGIGLNDLLKKEIWDNQSKFLGRLIKYKYQEVGTKDKPRIPSFQGFRDERDM